MEIGVDVLMVRSDPFMPSLFDPLPQPSTNPLGDFGKNLGQAAKRLYGNQAKQMAQNGLDSIYPGLGDGLGNSGSNSNSGSTGDTGEGGINFNPWGYAFGQSASVNYSCKFSSGNGWSGKFGIGAGLTPRGIGSPDPASGNVNVRIVINPPRW